MCEIISFSKPFHEEQHKIHGNKLILFPIAKRNNKMMSWWTAFFWTFYVFGSMKWWQNHFDIIIILIIWCQDYRKEKELRVEGNNGLRSSYWWYWRMTKQKRMTRNMYTTREQRTGHMFCVLLPFVLTDNKCILSCAIIIYMEQIAHWTKATKNSEWEGNIVVFHSSSISVLFPRLCN